MIPAVYVIDTSYLLELFRVPKCSEDAAVAEVRKRHKEAIENDSRLYVPIPCIFELGNHVAGISDGHFRKELAYRISETIDSSVAWRNPWNITPSTGTGELPRLWESFSGECVVQGVGLTDTFAIQEARRLKEKYRRYKSKVHIWTRDRALKAWEPDAEENPFVGWAK